MNSPVHKRKHASGRAKLKRAEQSRESIEGPLWLLDADESVDLVLMSDDPLTDWLERIKTAVATDGANTSSNQLIHTIRFTESPVSEGGGLCGNTLTRRKMMFSSRTLERAELSPIRAKGGVSRLPPGEELPTILEWFKNSSVDQAVSPALLIKSILELIAETGPPTASNFSYVYSVRATEPLDISRHLKVRDLLPSLPARFRMQASTAWLTHEFLYDVDMPILAGVVGEIAAASSAVEVTYYDKLLDSDPVRFELRVLQEV